MKGLGSKDITIAMSELGAQLFGGTKIFLGTTKIFLGTTKKTQSSLEEGLTPELQQEKCEMSLEHVWGQQVKNCSKNHGICQKNKGA